MASRKILISYEEYQTLKAYKNKYIAIRKKENQVTSDQTGEGENLSALNVATDQSGQGQNPNANLEKIVLQNENSLQPPESGLIESGTVPDAVVDIDKSVPSLHTPSSESSKPKEDKTSDDPWYFIGVPKHV